MPVDGAIGKVLWERLHAYRMFLFYPQNRNSFIGSRRPNVPLWLEDDKDAYETETDSLLISSLQEALNMNFARWQDHIFGAAEAAVDAGFQWHADGRKNS